MTNAHSVVVRLNILIHLFNVSHCYLLFAIWIPRSVLSSFLLSSPVLLLCIPGPTSAQGCIASDSCSTLLTAQAENPDYLFFNLNFILIIGPVKRTKHGPLPYCCSQICDQWPQYCTHTSMSMCVVSVWVGECVCTGLCSPDTPTRAEAPCGWLWGPDRCIVNPLTSESVPAAAWAPAKISWP